MATVSPPQLLTIREALAALGNPSRSWLYRRIAEGQVRVVSINGLRRISVDELNRLVSEGTTSPDTRQPIGDHAES